MKQGLTGVTGIMRMMPVLAAMAASAHAQAPAGQPYKAADTALVETLQKPYSGHVDTDFMIRMIAQHEAGIERAKQALMHSSDAKVRMMAGDMLKSLNTDLHAMKAWMEQRGAKPQAALPAPMPKALPATLSPADKMGVAATRPMAVSASVPVTASLPPTDVVSDTMALNELNPAAGPAEMPAAPLPEEEIENTVPVMEFLDDVP